MERRRLLVVQLCFTILGVASSIPDLSGDPCVSDYRFNFSCVFGIRSDSVDKSKLYSLRFNMTKGPESRSPAWAECPLMVVDHSYHCNCQIIKLDDFFSIGDKYQIQLCNESNCHVIIKNFTPSEHIKLTPPPEVEVQESAETINITLQSKTYNEHIYLGDCLQYELSLQQSQSKEMRTFPLTSGGKFMSLDRKEQLKSEGEYCVKARYMPQEAISGYKATWSEWSESICWGINAEKENKLILVAKSLGPVCLFVAVLLLVYYSPAARMKIKTLSHTPSPAPFFQPLFQQHEGNLQDWLSPEGKFLVMYKTEENLVTDTVTFVAKPITKDPEENQVFNNPPVTHLMLQQGQTSYVGLPGVHEATLPVTIVCAGDTPYTQLPGSVWEFGILEVESAPPPSKGSLEISHDDSGCSFEDRSRSSECSLPSSPVDVGPQTCYCNDYCILNKTAEGIVPVLVTRESSGEVPSDSLQTGE